MKIDKRTVLRYRAVFGLAYVVLGIVIVARLTLVPAPPQQKLIGALLGLAIVGLGASRVFIFWRSRRDAPP